MAKSGKLFRIKKPVQFIAVMLIIAVSAYAVFEKVLLLRDVAIILAALLLAMLIYKIGKTIIHVIVFLVILALIYWFLLRRYLPLSFL